MVARLVRNEKVRGSNPLSSTKKPLFGAAFWFQHVRVEPISERYRAEIDALDPALTALVPGGELTPVDFGDVCINTDLEWPSAKRTTILLSPADLPKAGTQFDLAMAVTVLAAGARRLLCTFSRVEVCATVVCMEAHGDLRTYPRR